MESKVTIGVEYNKRGMIRDGLVDDISTKEMGIPLPRKGSGKNGNVIKRDVAKALVMGVFPDLSEEEVDKMVNNICGDISERQSPIPEATPKETLKLISAMDPQEKESFKELIRESMDKLAAEEKKIEKRMKFEARLEAKNAERSAIPEPLKPPKEKQGDSGSRAAQHARLRAPPEFTKFLPDVPNLYLHWEPTHSRAYAEFKNLKEYQRTKSKKIRLIGLRRRKQLLWQRSLNTSTRPTISSLPGSQITMRTGSRASALGFIVGSAGFHMIGTNPMILDLSSFV